MKRKYEITTISHPEYPWLHRIRALWEFRPGVRPGDLGGFVQSEENLSQEGTCWLFDDAILCGESYMDQQAVAEGSALVRGSAFVSGTAAVRDTAVVDDHVILMAGIVMGNAHVAGYSEVTASTETGAVPRIEGGNVYGDVSGAIQVKENVVILPGVTINNPTPDLMVIYPDRVEVERTVGRQKGIPEKPRRALKKKRSQQER